MAKEKKYQCPFVGKIVWKQKDWPMLECTAKYGHVTGGASALWSGYFKTPCIADDWTKCSCYQKAMGIYKGHSCFEHDYDGGVCLICGSTTHRDVLRDALGTTGYEEDRGFYADPELDDWS